MKKLVMLVMSVLSMSAVAAPPGGGKTGPAKWDGDPEAFQEKLEERERRARMFLVVAVAEALELNEAEALKLSEKVKVIEEKRRPIREGMFTAMREVKKAADGDSAALAQVDVNIQKVLDGRAQMAAMDKELFTFLSRDLTPQKKAKLALVLAKLHEARGQGLKKGRHK
ncbi:MAG: hypothetical protein AB1938_07530 [Myxococcota bacterium]